VYVDMKEVIVMEGQTVLVSVSVSRGTRQVRKKNREKGIVMREMNASDGLLTSIPVYSVPVLNRPLLIAQKVSALALQWSMVTGPPSTL
jgi:hypothetical protein